ncbi:MAG: hypothetical protein JO359_11030 [Candidatus Eremiobacteraeota bacterium]|nr:hypothetical protein [Candidatus Eremiobacteraeota bacterium]
MKNVSLLIACFAFVAGAVSVGFAQSPSPSASPTALSAPAAPLVSSFFPAVDQTTGVWQGCGPPSNEGAFVDFNTEHPRVRIVQVFIDASIPCKAPGSHAYIVVYQAAPFVRAPRAKGR